MLSRRARLLNQITSISIKLEVLNRTTIILTGDFGNPSVFFTALSERYLIWT